MDHGVLNLPLDRRGGGSLDAQIDRHVAADRRSTAARLKAARVRYRDALALAKAAIANVSDARMADLGRAHGLTVAQTRAQFVAAAVINPERVAKAMQRELGAAQ